MIKIFKKSLFIIFVIIIFNFLGCDFNKIEDDNYETYSDISSSKIKIGNAGDVYLANFNFDNYNIINTNVLKIKNIKSRQVIENDNNFYSPSIILDEKIAAAFYNNNRSSSRNVQNCKATLRILDYKINDTKDFYMYKDRDSLNTSAFIIQNGVCKYIGNNCIIWLIESDYVKISEEDCKELGETFDKIYDIETKIVGSNIYTTKNSNMIDPSDKIEIVFGDLLNDANTVRDTEVYGYFSPKDLYYESDNEFSNEGEIIYLDTYNFTNEKAKAEVKSTIVHEFNHLINFCVKKDCVISNYSDYNWYTEMLSMLMEDAFCDYLDIDFQFSPKFRLVNYMMKYGYLYSPFYWFSANDEKILYSYASTYALGAYLVRNYGGLELLNKIATNEYVGLDSIEDALLNCGYIYDKINNDYNSFNIALKKEPLILINYEKQDLEDLSLINKADQIQYHTLNRTWKSDSFPDLSFNAINIKDSFIYQYYDENKDLKEETKEMYPIFIDPCDSLNQYIYYGGFALYYIGKNLKEFYAKLPSNFSSYYETYYPGY